MTETATPSSEKAPFQTGRWMIDSGKSETESSGIPVDTDGDGVADTLSLRVEAAAPRRTWLRTLGSWIGRFIVSIVVVASLVAAGMAVTSAYYQRQDVKRMNQQVANQKTQLADLRSQNETLSDKLTSARADRTKAEDALEDTKRELKSFEVENNGLRIMLTRDTTKTSMSAN